jgi:hypothetical protein
VSALSASGVPLEGSRLMRVTYMDESGSSPRDPIVVAAAVIVHGDDQVVLIEEYLDGVIEKHIPEENKPDFFFHATDLYHGGGKKSIFSNKDVWPEEKRWAILDDLVAVPGLFKIPICFGRINKSMFEEVILTENPRKKILTSHAMAIVLCELSIEKWMRNNTDREITHIVAEDNHDVREAAKTAHVLLRHKALESMVEVNNHPLPLKRIRDGLQFTSKGESRLLQVADVCAWSIRRFISNSPYSERFYEPLRGQIVL